MMDNKTSSGKQPSIGDIYLMEFTGINNEQRGMRPGLVFQNNTGNRYSPNIIALPLTTAQKKMFQPTHVYLPADETGLKRNSIVLCESPERMSKNRIGFYLTTLSDEFMAQIAIANLLATSAISFVSPDKLMSAREMAISLNEPIKKYSAAQ